MTISTNLKGRLRNTVLNDSNAMLPVYEAIVNSIHAVESPDQGNICLEIMRNPAQSSMQFEEDSNAAEITAFRVVDNGVGFDDENMKSFETLDSEHKSSQGCRGVGRLLWLKAFDDVQISSVFLGADSTKQKRTFAFNANQGVSEPLLIPTVEGRRTSITLTGFKSNYQKRAPKTLKVIAQHTLEHCLWYFVRVGGAPTIEVKDGAEKVSLVDLFGELMLSSKSETIEISGQVFNLIHLRLRSPQPPHVSWCAGGCVVESEPLSGKVPGLHGRLSDGGEEFTYACYVTSDFLDENVRSERTSFDIKADPDLLADELAFSQIKEAVFSAIEEHLEEFLVANRQAGRERVEAFVANEAPRYKSLLPRMSPEKLAVDPKISNKKLELLLHEQLTRIEGEMLAEGHEVMNFGEIESFADYKERLTEYLKKVDDFKKSDLASYVSHRKVVLELLKKAISKDDNGKYSREEIVHALMVPLQKSSSEVAFESCNFWLIDERLAFHDYLASDKPLSSMPVFTGQSNKEPDIIALKVFDEPLLLNEGKSLPLASIVVVEIKRPMRNDAAQGEEKDPIEQALGYLKRVRNGQVLTPTGRPIPQSNEIPGFCYVVCDITPSIRQRCEIHDLRVTDDHMGYFGYKDSYKAYIEVISFDRLVNLAQQRNRAFFDKLGLPTT